MQRPVCITRTVNRKDHRNCSEECQTERFGLNPEHQPPDGLARSHTLLVKTQKEERRDGGKKEKKEELLSSFLHVILYKLSGIFFQNLIDLIN